MSKPNIKKSIHTGEFDHLSAPSIRLAITQIRLELDTVEQHLHEKRVRAHWLAPEEKNALSQKQIAERQHEAMLSVQRLAKRWNHLTARFCEAWQVWQLKLTAEQTAVAQ